MWDCTRSIVASLPGARTSGCMPVRKLRRSWPREFLRSSTKMRGALVAPLVLLALPYASGQRVLDNVRASLLSTAVQIMLPSGNFMCLFSVGAGRHDIALVFGSFPVVPIHSAAGVDRALRTLGGAPHRAELARGGVPAGGKGPAPRRWRPATRGTASRSPSPPRAQPRAE